MQFNDYIAFTSAIIAIAALVVAVVTLYVAWRIPHQIMLYQRYSDLMCEYRTIEMGEAIFSIFDFYEKYCDSKVENIERKYVCFYNNEIRFGGIKDRAKSLHFKRRLVDQLFWLIADLRFNPDYPIKLSAQQLKRDFSKNENNLLYILGYMNIATRKVFITPENIPNTEYPFEASSPMAKYRKKLYKESKTW